MPQFRSLPSFQRDSAAGVMEEHSSDMYSGSPSTTKLLGNTPTIELYPVNTDQLFPVTTRPLYDIPKTQPLIPPTQPLTQPLVPNPKKTDQLLVIPGSRKHTKMLPEIVTPTRRMRRRTRHGLALGTALFFLVVTLLSLAPLDDGQSTYHILSNVVNWANTQQQGWTISSHNATATQMAQTNPVTPNGTPAGLAPPIALPTNQYVAIARQDAIDAGISPDYFERQIFAESGFNPSAASGAGAVGIAQFEPGTAAGLGINPYDPIQALSGAAKLMASYSNQYGGDYAKALAAYNAGSGNVAAATNSCGGGWLRCMPAETQNYIYKIMGI